uniref:Uncharacterized protein n=1 Tax=Anguilla anguilla TaxID=7936 RepID=A0A0E9TJ07_ANGAN
MSVHSTDSASSRGRGRPPSGPSDTCSLLAPAVSAVQSSVGTINNYCMVKASGLRVKLSDG